MTKKLFSVIATAILLASPLIAQAKLHFPDENAATWQPALDEFIVSSLAFDATQNKTASYLLSSAANTKGLSE